MHLHLVPRRQPAGSNRERDAPAILQQERATGRLIRYAGPEPERDFHGLPIPAGHDRFQRQLPLPQVMLA